MKKLSGKFQKLIHRGDREAGSSTAPTTGTAAAEDTTSAENFVNKVIALANGTVTGDEHIRELAGMVGPAIFSIAVSADVAQNYWVGLQGGNKVKFVRGEESVNDPKYRIPSSLVVPTTLSKDLAITVADGKLESITFKTGQCKELDLATVSPASCLFVLTTQFTGCTFAIGCVGTKLYMGHAMRSSGVKFAENGTEVAASLKEKRETMFQDVENLESTFFVSLGKEFKAEESGVTYTDGVYTNVIGLVCNRKIYFIVATKLPSDKIENVVLVTQETGTREWRSEVLPKTW